MSIRAVVFDFGNVLGHFSWARAARQLAVYGPPGLRVEEIEHYLAHDEHEDAFESGRLTTDAVLARLSTRFGLSGAVENLALAYADMFTPNEAVCALVPALHGRYRLGLLSNTNPLHYPHFRRQFARTLDRFDTLVVSHEVGLRKPDPRIYEHARRQVGCAAGQCLFIDDLPTNVEAARASGWHGILYRPGDDLRARLQQAGVALAPCTEKA